MNAVELKCRDCHYKAFRLDYEEDSRCSKCGSKNLELIAMEMYNDVT
jgi:predicted Zn-ribbon and HTH transcriptional regulator